MSTLAFHPSPFEESVAPDWSAVSSSSSSFSDSPPSVVEVDPFAGTTSVMTVDSRDPFEVAFSEFTQQTSPASAASSIPSSSSASSASALAFASSSSDAIVAPVVLAPLADSLEYVARLEKRLARLHTRSEKKDFKHQAAGSEFIGGSSSSSSSSAFPSASSSNATTSWLDLPDSVPAAADHAVSLHSSEDEDDGDDEAAEIARRRAAALLIPAAVEERVALLSQHDQQMDDGDMRQLEQARREATEDFMRSSEGSMIAAAADSASIAASSSSASAAASSTSPLFAVSSSSSPSSMIAMSVPSSHVIESSDGDDTAAPSHIHAPDSGSSSGGGTNSTPAGLLPLRALYYQSASCMAHVAGWWEERESTCVIA